jgi:DNA-binding XRE family transcriptional regulator
MPDTLKTPEGAVNGTRYAFNGTLFTNLACERGAETLDEAAQLCGISRRTLIRIRAGSFNPTLKTATRVAEALGVAVVDLFPTLGRRP